ncbi:HEXXH motif-containing putative peptide modification protein [Streptomyces sp. NPDC050263]|uniref:aKG-HExxH-type peptide beta-hydroxylase n=1 Tax=Streptomyces sp. NPDC050263 TaxID=3155037 RepID=UPI00342F0ADB
MTDDGRPAAPGHAPVLPAGLWRQIARGTPDPATLRLLRTARAGRDLLLLRALHHDARGTAGWDAAVAVLAAVRRHTPAVFDALISDPATGTVLAAAVRGGGREEVVALAAVAGHRAGLPFRLRTPVRDGALVLPGLGRAVLGPGGGTACVERGAYGTTVTAGGRRAAVHVPDVPGAAAPGWEPEPLLRLTARGARLTLRLTPHGRAAERRGPGGADGPDDADRWRDRLGAAWDRLADRHPDRADTVRGTVRAVADLASAPSTPTAPARWRSASFSDAFGLVALAPLDAPAELAAALVHETQHSLLYALQDLTPLLDAPPGAHGTAPWSDRPRPPSALLHGAAAFLVTAGFWRTEAACGEPAARAPYERWRDTVRRACDELDRGGWLTTSGRLLLDAVREVLAEWETAPV